MRMIKTITEYINDKELVIHVYKDRINIVNYIEIPDFSNNNITIKHENGLVKIAGSNLVVTKLLDEEVLITGEIKQIELR